MFYSQKLWFLIIKKKIKIVVRVHYKTDNIYLSSYEDGWVFCSYKAIWNYNTTNDRSVKYVPQGEFLYSVCHIKWTVEKKEQPFCEDNIFFSMCPTWYTSDFDCIFFLFLFFKKKKCLCVENFEQHDILCK